MTGVSAILPQLLMAIAAVHAFVGLYSLAAFARFRPNAVYGGFGLASLGASLYAAGGARLAVAADVAQACHGQKAQALGMAGVLAGSAFVLFGLLDRPRHPIVKAAVAWATLGGVLILAGLFFDPTVAVESAHVWARPQARLLPVGVVHAAGSVALLGIALLYVLRPSLPTTRDVRHIVLFGMPSIVAWLVDTAHQVAGLAPRFLLEHTSIFTSIGVSYVLLGRFIRLDDALRERTRELRLSYIALQEAQEELVRTEQLAAVGELSAVIAHEVRHPLRALEQAVGALSQGELPRTEEGHLLGSMDEEADRLNRLVRDLLAYARPVTPQNEAVHLDEVMRRATKLPADRADSVQVALHIDTNLPTVHGDPDLLLRSFTNIVDNAVQAMPAGGTLTVRARRTLLDDHAPAVALSFEDTGEGMDQIVREKARDPFFTTRPTGTGLGLAIVERVVRAHGGTMELQSADGGGTAVVVTLPVERRTSLPPVPMPAGRRSGAD
jgi:signal transduction histidine kinase